MSATRNTLFGLIILFPFCHLAAEPKTPQVKYSITGKVVAVADGDTVTLLVGKDQIKVRLEGIDAPEKNQDFGTVARTRLGEMVHERQVRVDVTGTDRYGRTLGFVVVEDVNTNLQMVAEGLAWHYTTYNSDPRFAEAEKGAKEANRGLWSHSRPVPPWEFRKIKRQPAVEGEYWLNISSGVRHNSQCEHFRNTARGRACTANEGKPCGRCGG